MNNNTQLTVLYDTQYDYVKIDDENLIYSFDEDELTGNKEEYKLFLMLDKFENNNQQMLAR